MGPGICTYIRDENSEKLISKNMIKGSDEPMYLCYSIFLIHISSLSWVLMLCDFNVSIFEKDKTHLKHSKVFSPVSLAVNINFLWPETDQCMSDEDSFFVILPQKEAFPFQFNCFSEMSLLLTGLIIFDNILWIIKPDLIKTKTKICYQMAKLEHQIG